MAKLIRKKRGTKKRGLSQALFDALHEKEAQRLSTKQGASHMGAMMMLRAKRLRKWLLWLKRRRLRLKKRLRDLEALEQLLKEEMALAKECGMAFQWITEPAGKQAADPEEDYPLNAQEISALLASFSQSTAKHLGGLKNPPAEAGSPLLGKKAKPQHNTR